MELKTFDKKSNIPDYFAPILWSFEISKIDPRRNKKTVIIQAINYGDLKHWRWIAQYYGMAEVRRILTTIPVTEIRPRVRRLAALIFHIKNFHHALRGTE